jgi:hypothetical protein
LAKIIFKQYDHYLELLYIRIAHIAFQNLMDKISEVLRLAQQDKVSGD